MAPVDHARDDQDSILQQRPSTAQDHQVSSIPFFIIQGHPELCGVDETAASSAPRESEDACGRAKHSAFDFCKLETLPINIKIFN